MIVDMYIQVCYNTRDLYIQVKLRRYVIFRIAAKQLKKEGLHE